MSFENEIISAVGAHGAWKMRLRSAINSGKSENQVATVQQDQECDFGKWLSAAESSHQASGHYKKVRQLHARFHAEAAHVLGLALKGNKAEAEKSMAPGGAFAQVSSQLTAEMMAWKNEAGR